MYNAHRGMMPHQVPNNRLAELFEQIRAEFENHAGRAGDFEQQQRESLMNQHIQELNVMREKVYQLEQQHHNMKQDYEKQIDQLRRELADRGGSVHMGHGGPQHGGPGQPQAPSIGHGPNNLFGGIMTGSAAQGGSGLAPPPQEPPQHQGLPAHLTQGAALNTGPQPQQQQPPQPFGGYQPAPGVNGYGPQAPHPTASPGPGRARPARGGQGGGTPQQNAASTYPGSPRQHGPTPPPGQRQQPHPPAAVPIPEVGNQLSRLSPNDLPPQFKKEGDEWWVIFNPQVARQLDVNLVHTLEHNSVVCCVRFSHDGRYVATGCNRAAQIFDVDSGQMMSHLEDDTAADKDGDLYIRSVCFSPDGKFLATGAEDKIIRVWDIAAKEVKAHFTGHEQDIYSLDFARNGRTIASGSGDKTVRLWDLETKSNLMTLTIEDGVTTVSLSGDGRLVAAGSLDRSVRVWDAESGMPIDRLDGPDGHEDSVYSVAFSPSGRELVSGSLDRKIKLWELTQPPPRGSAPTTAPKSTGKCIRTFEGHADFVLSVALTPDAAWVLSGSKDRGVQFWDPRTGVTQLYLQGHRNSVISVAPSPKGTIFATGSGDQKAKIWSYTPYRG